MIDLYLLLSRALPVRGVSMDDDGDVNPGTTTVEILNKEQDEGIFFEAYSQIGFLLSSGIRVMGPCAVFPKSILHWNVSTEMSESGNISHTKCH